MAVTKGHGNPSWTREEVILALELYHRLGGVIPAPNDPRIVELSRELRSIPYHATASKRESFRNPDGVAFKLQNLRAVATGKGLSNTAKMDHEVWERYGAHADATAEAAARIRSSLKHAGNETPSDEDLEFSEGRAVTQLHQRIERDRAIRQKLLRRRHGASSLYCDVCGVTGDGLDAAIRDAIFEAHHKIPLSHSGEVKTRLSDMALLCASCHRLIHRLMAVRKDWASIDEAKREIRKARP